MKNKRDWFCWIYNFNFNDAFLSVFDALGEDRKYAEYRLSRWKIEQENMDDFEAEVFILNTFRGLE